MATPINIDKTRSERLARARLSLINAESSVGVTPVTSLERGRIWHVENGNAGLFRALADLIEPGQWIGFVGFPNVGWCAAQEMGLPLNKVISVPRVGGDAARALAALIDGVDLIACGPIPLTAKEQRSLAGRARARRATVFSTRPWAGISRPWYGESERGQMGTESAWGDRRTASSNAWSPGRGRRVG